MSELVTEDMNGSRRVAEASGDFGGWQLVDEEGAQGFVLALRDEPGWVKKRLGLSNLSGCLIDIFFICHIPPLVSSRGGAYNLFDEQ